MIVKPGHLKNRRTYLLAHRSIKMNLVETVRLAPERLTSSPCSLHYYLHLRCSSPRSPLLKNIFINRQLLLLFKFKFPYISFFQTTSTYNKISFSVYTNRNTTILP
ncbi:hypothetical protein HanIR_Chr11g0530241 [Helianthus annuus]|nr:hypothetical protein HanIR_Chr11g0530241 [Helianthus annuus]